MRNWIHFICDDTRQFVQRDRRAETLKAYGNAIVPQVMYRIFQAIESVEE